MDDRPGMAVQPDRELATPKDKLMSNGGVNEPHWERVKELFAHAVSLPPHARAEWIVQACGDDAELLAELNALLGAHDGAGDFLNTPVLADPAAAQAVADATQSADTPQPVPARCGPYRIVREVGHGGMGIVYLGARDDDQFEKLVAIKIVGSSLAHPFFLQRFHAERRILAGLDHPNIARLLDAGTTETGIPYVVMEYVDGQPIDLYCAAHA